MGKMIDDRGLRIEQAARRSVTALAAISALGAIVALGTVPAEAFPTSPGNIAPLNSAGYVAITPTDVWTSGAGVFSGSGSVNGTFGSVNWTSTGGSSPGHVVTATAFSFQDGSSTPATSGVTVDAAAGNGGLGVCSSKETSGPSGSCPGEGDATTVNYEGVGGSAVNVDVLKLHFATAAWIPVGISLSATSGDIDYVIIGDNNGIFGDGDDTSLGTFAATNATCGTGPTYETGTSSSGVNFLCYSGGNVDQFEFDNSTAFQNLYVMVDTTAAGTGNQSFRVHDLEGVLPAVPEPATLTLFGLGLLGLGLARQRRNKSA